MNRSFNHFFLSLFYHKDHGYLYQTGDYASVREDGVIQYEGRTDSQVKIRGHRVDLSEIQKHLLEIDGVDKAIVLCNKDEFGKTILAFVSATGELMSPAPKFKKIIHIEDILRAKLADYMIPQIVIVDEMPLLVNGKIDRQALLMMYTDLNNNGKCFYFHSTFISPFKFGSSNFNFFDFPLRIGHRL